MRSKNSPAREWEVLILGEREFYKWQFREIIREERPFMTVEQFDEAWHRAQLGQAKLLEMMTTRH